MTIDTRIPMLAAIILALSIIAGCTTLPTQPMRYSGFLNDYSGLRVESKGFARYISPNFNPANYRAILIEPVQYYPRPTPSDKVSRETLQKIASYINQSLRDQISKRVEVVDEPGPEVVRLRVAVTAVGAEGEALKPYQYIPVAFVLAVTERMVTGAPELATLSVESEATDSVSGERLAASVRSGTGELLKPQGSDAEKQVTLAALKSMIDKGVSRVAQEVTRYVQTE